MSSRERSIGVRDEGCGSSLCDGGSLGVCVCVCVCVCASAELLILLICSQELTTPQGAVGYSVQVSHSLLPLFQYSILKCNIKGL